MNQQHKKVFHDFKQAEEFVHYHLENKDNYTWTLRRLPNEVIEEDGETYSHEAYEVTWSGS